MFYVYFRGVPNIRQFGQIVFGPAHKNGVGMVQCIDFFFSKLSNAIASYQVSVM